MERPRQSRDIVVFTGKYSGISVVENVELIARTFPRWSITVFHEFPPRRWRSELAKKIRWALGDPVSFALALSDLVGSKLTGPPVRPDKSSVGVPTTLDRVILPNVVYRRVAALHGAATIKAVKSLTPWLGISLAAPILKRKLFALPELGTINLHKSLLPNFRGSPPGFWELHDGALETGASIHWVDDKLDTGAVVLQRALPIPKYSTPRGLALALDLLGNETLVEALGKIDEGTAAAIPQPTAVTQTNRQPSRLKHWRVRRLTWRRRGSAGVADILRLLHKNLIVLAYVYLYVPPRNLLRSLTGRSHVTVLLYHRVNDGFLDSVTIGVEQFARQAELLARRYEILDLPTLLAQVGSPRRRAAVVLTFDDGYEDNLLAAMILRRAGLPCTFFLSTRIVGSKDRAFPHDLKRLRMRVPALLWDQVRRMREWGFHFGNHTRDHTNLSLVPPDEALSEIASASEDLERELGEPSMARVLAYPYGTRSDITEEVRGRLRSVGIAYCLSAYGGANPPQCNPLDIRRQGINHAVTETRLLAAIEGWTIN
jgi:peptidoglycan/xylan/chitin deacetylase (PgdA/CDA1 family)